MSTYGYQRSVRMYSSQLDNCPRWMIKACIALENRIIDVKGRVTWEEDETPDGVLLTFTAVGPKRLVDAWVEAAYEIVDYKAKARGW